MAIKKRACRQDEEGLSEVVGFVLLIAVVIAAFSIYLIYGIPVQGRDNEIRHMSEVKDEFIGYKIGVDSLWTNAQTDTILSTTITMGTAGATSLGNSGFLPIMQPVASGGTVAINQRTVKPENISITAYSNIITTTNPKTQPVSIPSLQQLQNPPKHLFVNISVSDKKSPYGVRVYSTNWSANVSVIPRYEHYNETLTVDCTVLTSCTVLTWKTVPSFTGTDITISLARGSMNVTDGYVVYSNIAPGTYSIDLMNDAYGLAPVIVYPAESVFATYGTGSTSEALIIYPYSDVRQYQYEVPMGALEYRANNYYWIPQTYYYQMGGIFLSQTDGISPRLSPAISFTYNRTKPGPILVNVDAIAFDQGNSLAISGTTPLQIGTKLKSDSANLPYATISANTMNVSINITSPTGDPHMLQMWKQYFEEAANKTGGIPNNQDLYNVGNTTTEAYIFIKGAYDPTKSGGINAGTPDISLKAKAVNLTATIQGIGSV